jgi:hypothetical protein
LVSHMDQVLKKALVTDDPEGLFKSPLEPAEPKEEPPPFPGKVDEVPGPEILPQ